MTTGLHDGANDFPVSDPGWGDTKSTTGHDDIDLPYVCVHCGAPCAALYRQLGTSLSSIKAVDCLNCGQRVVDPYIEREWLLIVIDILLLRAEAYRHVLYNATEFQSVSWRRAVQLIISSSILNAHLKWETLQRWQSDHATMTGGQSNTYSMEFPDDEGAPMLVFLLVVTGIFDVVVEWLAICGYLRFARSETNNGFLKNKVGTKVFWGLILPTAFQVVMVLVLIWENSKTTRSLGSMLIAFWQGLAISLISQNSNMRSNSVSVVAPVVGMAAVTLWRFGVSLLLLPRRYPSPCVGLEVDVTSAFGDGRDHHRWPPLCLT